LDSFDFSLVPFIPVNQRNPTDNRSAQATAAAPNQRKPTDNQSAQAAAPNQRNPTDNRSAQAAPPTQPPPTTGAAQTGTYFEKIVSNKSLFYSI
jgi:hypothetical protein